MVSPSPESIAAQPGLIGVTSPGDRVKQLETGLAPLTTKKPRSVQVGLVSDPFAFLPPQMIQGSDKADGTKKDGGLPKFSELKIPKLPLLPTNTRPPQILAASQPTTQLPSEASPRAIPGLPKVPGINPPAVGRPVSIPSIIRGRSPIPAITTIGRSPIAAITINIPSRRNDTISPPPSLPVVSKPIQIRRDLPQLPTDKRPPQWRPSPSLPVASEPIRIPGLPPLSVDKRPAQWRTPTELAEGLKVTGVVTVGNETLIIVQVPDESTSRYIKVGERVANGKVLIKRVEVQPGSELIVIVEQNGIEFAKSVGATS
jgi:hypothetical protein